jgi:tRNA nucleotidyltransferase/poly(A) polymerase/2'-5' RNA ligase
MKKRLRAFYEMTGLDAYDEPNEEYSEVFQDTDYEKFIDGVKSMVRENKQFSGKAYRVDSMFSNKDATAGDVVRYERDELENVDDFAHITDKKLAELDKYPAKKIIWVTKTFEDAKRYSNEPDFSDIDEFDLSGEVIGEDGDGGYLVLIKNNVSEEIDAKEAYTDNGALRTVLNGKRTVGFIELTKDNIGKVQKYNIGVIPVRMKTGNTIMSIIYRPEGKNKAYRLYEIAKSHGGYLNDKSPDEAREIGRILGYKEATIDEYVRRKYNKIPVLPEPSPDDYDDLSEGQISILQDLPFKNDVEERGGKIYSVGGAVRDDFLGKESKDLDVLITGIPMEELEQLLSKYGRVDAVGKSFGVLKFRAQGGDEIDVAIPRTEKPTGDAGHKAFDVTSDHALPIEKDLERRDFTINAIAKDSEGNIVDPYGGQEDLKNKIIRIVNPEAFSDDPLRMLRAVQFASRFGFKIEPETLRMIQSTADRIREIPPERILTEFDKIVKKGNKLTGAILLKSTGLLREIFGKDAGLLMGQNIWENAKTMGEFIWLLSHNLVENPAEFLKNNLKGDIDAYKEIKALQMAFDSGEATNMIEARAVASNMYLTSPQSLQSQILPAVIKTAAQELLQGKYPKSVNELAINGNDLMQLGLKGKEIGDMQKSILLKVYANKIRNNREDLLALAGQNNNVIKEEISDRVEYGCLMLFLDVPIWERITSKIRPEDLYIGGGEYGVEKEPHLTILYGFHDEVTAEDVFDLVKEKIPMRPIQVRITGISIFENLEFDVVKFDVNSPELTKLNDILRQLPNTTKFPEYHAHITIAYVKPGEGKKYIKPFQNEHMLKGDELVFTWKGHRGKEGGEVLKLSEVGALAETYPENKYVVNTQQLKVNYLLKKYDEWNNYNEKYIDPSRETVEEFIQQQFPDLIHDRKLKLDLYWALTDREVLNEIV